MVSSLEVQEGVRVRFIARGLLAGFQVRVVVEFRKSSSFRLFTRAGGREQCQESKANRTPLMFLHACPLFLSTGS